MLTAFPLQTKHFRSLASPWLKIGVCEVMNGKVKVNTAPVMFHNYRNVSAVSGCGSVPQRLSGFTMGAGVLDSYEGQLCSEYVAAQLQNIFSDHVDSHQRQRELLRTLPRSSPMASALEATHAIRRVTRAGGANSHSSFIDVDIMEQYAQSVDTAFFEACRNKFGPDWATSGVEQVGARGAWFSSTLNYNAAEQGYCVRVEAANVGDSRAFVIATNPKTEALLSGFVPTRHRVAQLSADHHTFRGDDHVRITRAGGRVDSSKDGLIDGHPHMNVARAFGYWCMKSDPRQPPSRQKVIPRPTSSQRTLNAGDIVVALNFGAFETRSGGLSTVDDIADVVVEALAAGASPEEAAGEVCDYAMAFGAHHSLIASVSVVSPTLDSLGADVDSNTALLSTPPVSAQSVVPGPLHPGVCFSSQDWHDGFLTDIKRCGLTVEQWLELRYTALKPMISPCGGRAKRLPSELSLLFPRGSRMLKHQIFEEIEFFEQAKCNFEALAHMLRRPVKVD